MADIKISLTRDVRGALPAANIDLSDDFDFTGALTLNSDAVATEAYADAAAGDPSSMKEGASTALINLQRRTAELHVLPTSNGAVVNTGSGAQSGDVAQSGTPGMSVVVSACKAYSDGNGSYGRVAVPAGNQTVNLSAADATNPRYDAIVLPAGPGNVSPTKREGTPAGSPSLPTLTAGDVLLAVVKVAALDTSITNAEIFDHRRYANPSPRIESFTADGSTAAFTLAKRVHGITSVTVDGRTVNLSADADQFSYQISEPVEANGTRITFGANLDVDSVVIVNYNA